MSTERELTGKQWSAGTTAFRKFANQYRHAHTDEAQTVVAGVAAQEIYNAILDALPPATADDVCKSCGAEIATPSGDCTECGQPATAVNTAEEDAVVVNCECGVVEGLHHHVRGRIAVPVPIQGAPPMDVEPEYYASLPIVESPPASASMSAGVTEAMAKAMFAEYQRLEPDDPIEPNEETYSFLTKLYEAAERARANTRAGDGLSWRYVKDAAAWYAGIPDEADLRIASSNGWEIETRGTAGDAKGAG